MVMTPNRIDRNQSISHIRADHVPGPKQGDWTYSHYLALPDDGQRYEIIDGVLYMSPAPSRWHQKAVLNIATILKRYIEQVNRGEVYIAPFDVRLTESVVVQPDVLVVLQERLDVINDARVMGAPDLVVEVASPGTSTMDRRQKYDDYAQAGVSEYWLVDPLGHTVEVLVLEGKTYQELAILGGNAQVLSKLVPELAEVTVDQFFL